MDIKQIISRGRGRENSPETIRQQIRICREEDLPGIVIFSHSWKGISKNHWKVLQEEFS